MRETISGLRDLRQIKLLADKRRRGILRMLMASPATVSQLSRSLHRTPAWIQYHVKSLESAALVEMTEVRKTGRVTEKYYLATARAYIIQDLVIPKSRKPTIIFSGSHDLAIPTIAECLVKRFMVINLYVGSLDGLVNLRQGLCHISGAHLRDERGEFNIAYIRRLFPDREMEMVTLAHRVQGLLVAAGNPKAIRLISDLARPDIRFVNRNPGSGTRLWLDEELKRAQISPRWVKGFGREVKTHIEAASLVESGQVDAALGLQAAAYRHRLGFVPLFEERYDFVLPRTQERILAPFLDFIQTEKFRNALSSLTGYNPSHSGEQILI